MKLIYNRTLKGSHVEYNEDIISARGDFAWVADGATDLFGANVSKTKEGDVYHFMNHMNETLLSHSPHSNNISTLLSETMSDMEIYVDYHMKGYRDLQPWEQVTFSIALVHFRPDNTMEYFILGDCFIEVDGKVITDNRIQPFSLSNKAKIKANPDKKLEIYQDTRKLLNTKGGYWIGSLDKNGFPHAITDVIKNPQKVMLYTDGYYQQLHPNFKHTDKPSESWGDMSLLIFEKI